MVSIDLNDPRFNDALEIIEDGNVPKEDRELDVAKVLEEKLLEDFGDIYSDIFIELFLKTGEETITIGAIVKEPAPDFWIDIPLLNNIKVERDVDEIREAYSNLAQLTEMFDTRNDRFPEIKEKLQAIADTTEFRLQRQPITERMLGDEQVEEIATRSPGVWANGILPFMSDVSPAWRAAQEVSLVDDGNDAIAKRIENRIASSPKRGYLDWYLEKAYEWYLEGVWDAEEYFDKYYKLFRPGESVRKAQDRRKKNGFDPITEDEYPELGIPNLSDTLPEGVQPDPVDDGRIGESRPEEKDEDRDPEVLKNESGTTSHSLRDYSPEYFRDKMSSEREDDVRATFNYVEDGRFEGVMNSLHDAVNDMTGRTSREFLQENGRLKEWYDVYVELFDLTKETGRVSAPTDISPETFRDQLKTDGQRDTMVALRDIGEGERYGTFSQFLLDLNDMIHLLDKDEKEDFFSDKMNLLEWLQVFQRAEEIGVTEISGSLKREDIPLRREIEEKTEEIASEQIQKKLVSKIDEMDDGDGVFFDQVIPEVSDITGASEDRVEDEINNLLSKGAIYEPRPGSAKLLDVPSNLEMDEDIDVPEAKPAGEEQDEVEDEPKGLHEMF